MAAAAPVAAIPNTCPTAGADAVTVNINEPAAGAKVAGQVTVRGRATGGTGLTKVELFVGESLKDFQLYEPPSTNVEFALRFDAAAVRSDKTTMSVVACGSTPGSLVRGIASVDVQVDRGAAPSTAPVQLVPAGGTTERPATGTAERWVGPVFGLAGLVGLVVALRVRGARGATAPSRDAGAGAGGRSSRPDRRLGDLGAAPPRPSPAPRVGAPGRPAAAPGREAAAEAPSPDAGATSADGEAGRRRRRVRRDGGPAASDGGRPARRG